MNWRVYYDSTLSGLEPIDAEVDGYEVFATFLEAKRELLRYLRSHRDQYVEATKEARRLKPHDFD